MTKYIRKLFIVTSLINVATRLINEPTLSKGSNQIVNKLNRQKYVFSTLATFYMANAHSEPTTLYWINIDNEKDVHLNCQDKPFLENKAKRTLN